MLVRGSVTGMFAALLVCSLVVASSSAKYTKAHHITRLINSRQPPIHPAPNNYKLAAETITQIKGEDVNDNIPIFSEIRSGSVFENENPGTHVMQVRAFDADGTFVNNQINYALEDPSDPFDVDPNTGNITTLKMFDREERSFYSINIIATDNSESALTQGKHNAGQQRFLIEIADKNDNRPHFTQKTYVAESIAENANINELVTVVSALDVDTASVVSYKIIAGNIYDAFNIRKFTGEIRVNSELDYENITSYSLVVRAFDGIYEDHAIVIINIENLNDNPPVFLANYTKTIEEEKLYDGCIVKVEAYDPDIEDRNAPQNIVYSVVMHEQNEYFQIENDGCLWLTKPLDRDQPLGFSRWQILIMAADHGGILGSDSLRSTTEVILELTDINDNAPFFSEIRSGSVLENEKPGTHVMQVRAFNADGTFANNQINYALGDPTDPFQVDPNTGNITTLKMFDREERSFYSINIIATDNTESALTQGKHNAGQQRFLIEIADKNDNRPHFTQNTYVAESIAENANINYLVTVVSALDVDTASVVSYSIVAGNIYDAFNIRNITGEIRVNSELDYENITSYSLVVRAFDGIYEDHAIVIINIENLNDNPPVFLANYTKTIEEEKLYEGCIVKVEAYDLDIKDRNAPQNIVYSLVKHEQKEYLQIENDGCLWLTKPLDRDQPLGSTRWQILILAADHGGRVGSDSLRSTTEVILELTDINDNAPFLTNIQPVIWYENEPPGLVAILTANDYDLPENGPPFRFALNKTASFDIRSKFKIQGNILSTRVAFDREERKEYRIPVAITDFGTPRKTGVSTLHVVIGDRNDNPMGPGHSDIFVYNYKGEAPNTEIGRVFVDDPDDWDLPDKRFMWLCSYYHRSPYFNVHSMTGMITMKEGTPKGTYLLKFNVTEENEPVVYHSVEATVNVTIKEIPEEAVDKSGSIRFVNITAEEFIIPEADGTSKKDKLHRTLSLLYNTSMDNVDVFTVYSKPTVKDMFLDVRFSAHGSHYYPPEKLDSMVIAIQKMLEEQLQASIYMVKIDECIIEKEQCGLKDNSCLNVLVKNNVPLSVYTNTTSFVGVSARVESECKMYL